MAKFSMTTIQVNLVPLVLSYNCLDGCRAVQAYKVCHVVADLLQSFIYTEKEYSHGAEPTNIVNKILKITCIFGRILRQQ